MALLASPPPASTGIGQWRQIFPQTYHAPFVFKSFLQGLAQWVHQTMWCQCSVLVPVFIPYSYTFLCQIYPDYNLGLLFLLHCKILHSQDLVFLAFCLFLFFKSHGPGANTKALRSPFYLSPSSLCQSVTDSIEL